jgi:hypothetical protein
MEVSMGFEFDDNIINKNSILRQWGPIFSEISKIIEKSFTIIDNMKDYLETVGFENIVKENYQWPVGSWSSDEKLKIIGKYNRLFLLNNIRGFALRPLNIIKRVRELFSWWMRIKNSG